MKDLELVARIYNNQCKERREALGLSRKALADRIGVGKSTYEHLETLRGRPKVTSERQRILYKNLGISLNVGDWVPIASKLSRFFGVAPEELFPPITHEPLVTSVVRKKLDEVELRPILEASRSVNSLESHEDHLDKEALKEHVSTMLGTLTDRERTALALRFGLDGNSPHTSMAAGKKLGVSANRAMRIGNKALRKMRHPSRSRHLKAWIAS